MASDSVSDITSGMQKMKITKPWDDIFSTKNLNKIAKKLGNKYKDLGVELNYEQHHLDNFGDGSKPPKDVALAMLTNYRDKSNTYKTQKQVDDFITALKEAGLHYIVSDLQEERSVPTKPEKTPQQCTEPSTLGKEVFISYQWDKQPQVKKLYDVLTKRGYTCWMDIGQMGGGDALYGEIEKGIRGCKVVLSCITTRYAESGNCRREVTLADALKKPIIPLLLEPKMQWPPEGPMGMIFSQSLYIDFRKPSVEVQNNWESSPNAGQLFEKLDQYTKV